MRKAELSLRDVKVRSWECTVRIVFGQTYIIFLREFFLEHPFAPIFQVVSSSPESHIEVVLETTIIIRVRPKCNRYEPNPSA